MRKNSSRVPLDLFVFCNIEMLAGLFHAFDENQDNHIDFKEMACGISACCRGPGTERQKCRKHLKFNFDKNLWNFSYLKENPHNPFLFGAVEDVGNWVG